MEWEQIERGLTTSFILDVESERLKVPGGWILRSRLASSNGVSVHQIFIEDPDHNWKEAIL